MPEQETAPSRFANLRFANMVTAPPASNKKPLPLVTAQSAELRCRRAFPRASSSVCDMHSPGSFLEVKLRPWQFVLFLLLVAAAAIIAVFEFSRSSLVTPGELVAVLPHQDSIVFFINADSLRDAGVLGEFAGPKAGQEQDYQNFVTQSHFDYQRDLDRVAGTFNRGEVFLVIEGRFDWVRLREY